MSNNIDNDNIVEETESNEENPLNLSDEDFLKLQEPQESKVDESIENIEETAAEASTVDDEDTSEDNTDDKSTDVDKSETVENTIIKKETIAAENEGATDADLSAEGKADSDDAADNGVKDTTPEINYKAEYEKLTAPFKANGTEIKVKNIDDAITLMQMGANYQKKMVGLKPSLKILKLLEKHDLLDANKLNYLIDLNSKDPAAITKLLKDSKIDPLDIDVKGDTSYTPKSRSVSDTEIELDSVLEAISETPSYATTLNIITKQWDDASRNEIAAKPHIISVINEHVANGTFDTVMGAVNYERRLGKLQGVSDLEAYKYMGDVIYSTKQPSTNNVNTAMKNSNTESEEAKQARIERKKKASLTKTKSTPVKTLYNPLAMSDEEFEKFEKQNVIQAR